MADNAAIIRRALDGVLNEKRIEVLDQYWAEDVVDHSRGGGQGPGRAGIRDAVLWGYVNRPELHVSVDGVIAQGDIVATRETWTTANHVRQVYHWFKLRNGQVVQEWSGDNEGDEDPKPAA
jgi:hypothetical protein